MLNLPPFYAPLDAMDEETDYGRLENSVRGLIDAYYERRQARNPPKPKIVYRDKYRDKSEALTAFEKILIIAVILGLIWLFGVPAILGFNIAEKHKWGAIADAPEIIQGAMDRRNHAGRVIIDTGNGEITVETRDGEITRTIITGDPGEAAISDAARIARGEEWSGET